MQGLIDRFDRENGGEISVRLREMPADSGQHFDQLNTEFQSGESGIDVIGDDVIWPARFVANSYIANLSERFPESERRAFLPATIEANTYEGAVYGVPWYTDAGILWMFWKGTAPSSIARRRPGRAAGLISFSSDRFRVRDDGRLRGRGERPERI